jgi:7,8-dihydroneopterin aldolase/epimerase/oxygenase
MRFEGKHGYHDWELQTTQPFEVDVELRLNLQPAGVDDDLTKTVDYGRIYDIARQVVESTSFRLLEAIAEAISHEVLVAFDVQEVGVRVRKPAVKVGGPLDHAAVEIWRRPAPRPMARRASPRSSGR